MISFLMVILYTRHLNLCKKSFMMIVQKRKELISLKSIFLTFQKNTLLRNYLYGIMCLLGAVKLGESLFVGIKV
mgnify:FL=1